MSKIQTAFRLIKNHQVGLFFAAVTEKINFLFSDEMYTRFMFFFKMGYTLNLNNPKTFCEKIQWLKLYDRRNFYANLVDKCAVKGYVETIVGKKHIIPTLGVWNNADEIDYEKLPNQFVLKTTNGSGGLDVVICKNKSMLDMNRTNSYLKKRLKSSTYKTTREWPYKNIPPRIIAEKYMEDTSGNLNDYKFFCFNGNPKYCQVIQNRFVKETIDFFDLEWNHMPFVGLNPTAENACCSIKKPECLMEMINVCKKMAEGLPFVRIDFYVVNGNFFFGEMTFYPASGLGLFRPKDWDYKLGELLNLPSIGKEDADID